MSEQLSAIRGIEQGRASFAYKKVEEAREQLGEAAQKYKSYVKKIPMYIKTNGLGATLAFIKSKFLPKNGDKVYELIYQQLGEWLKRDDKELVPADEDLTLAVISMNSTEYRAVTNELLAMLNWLRRFADGLIEGEADDD